MNPAKKYVVRHANFNEYLRILDKPIAQLTIATEHLGTPTILNHVWEKDLSKATKFDTFEDAYGKSTSPLCAIYTIINGQIQDRVA